METENTTTNSENSGSNSHFVKEQEPTEILTKTEQILTFIDDKTVNDFSFAEGIDVIDDLENQGLESREHTVRDFLSRPVLLGEFTWDSTKVINDNIFSFDFPNALLSVPALAEKVAGFTYLKGDIKVRVQFNRQAFQAGILQIRTFPVVSPDDNFNTQLRTMKQFSGLPGLSVNLESEQPSILTIPYIYPNDVYDILKMPDSWATVYGRVYSPLTAASATSVTISVYAWFDKESLRLSMPTSLVPRKIASTLSSFYTEKLMELQVGGEKKNASAAGGPISKVANAVSTVATVASGIPGLGALATPVAVASNVVGSLASMFGFSKPTSDQIPTQVVPRYSRGMANSDCPDSTTQTALMTENNLTENKAIFRTDADEMAIAHMVRIPHYINSFSYSTSDPSGKLLYSLKLNPATITTDEHLEHSIPILTTTSLGIVSSCFELWRGSLNLTFKFAKTSFHSGRLMFVWFNVDANSFSVPTTYDPNFVNNYQEQVDFKDKYEYDVNIPYCQPVDWLNIHTSDSQFKDNNGVLAVYVINTLQAASTASSTVDVVVEARGGSDIEFAVPKVPELINYFINPVGSKVSYSTFDAKITSAVVESSSSIQVSFEIPYGIGLVETFTMIYTIDGPGSTYTMTHNIPVNSVITYQGVAYPVTLDTPLKFTPEYYNTSANGLIKTQIDSIVSGIFSKEITTNNIKDPFIMPSVLFTVTFPSTYMEKEMELQIGRDEAISGIDGISIAPAISKQNSKDVNEDTVGEKIASIRPLLKRYMPDFGFVQNSQLSKNFLIVDATNFTAPGLDAASYLALFVNCFRFFRGSTRYKLFLTYNTTDQQYPSVLQYYLLNNLTSDVLPYDPVDTCNSTNVYAVENEVAAEFNVPYYNRNRLTITGDVTSSGLLSPMSRRVVFDLGAGAYNVRLYRNAGEDFMLGTWLGAPTLIGRHR